ncbi:DUF2142 domain-containing protein [Methanobacterium aggregans]|uniref:DUF2142 domain-containing protein n=2 Tax=Methanobacterium aggregans TaxID=1615586 RepID=UPI001AE72428|nr:DUF2142 domain-containing protein [Methanobacterium aggregans]MBP2045679.1 putative membrane protein [Methanobacterium aggregans]
MLTAIKEMPPQKIFLIIGIIYGILFLIVTPPFQVPDEEVHFYKSYLLSQGTFTPEKVGNQAGFHVSGVLKDTTREFRYLRYPDSKVPLKLIFSALSEPVGTNKNVLIHPDNLNCPIPISYPPLPYVASAVVMAFLNLFNCSVLTLMYAGRLINLLVWLTLVYLAIKITPIHKWVFTLLALMPMTLAQAASLSADSFTIAISFLTIATILKYTFQTTKIGKKQIIALLLLTITLTLSKTGYFLILLLLLIIPQENFGNKMRKIVVLLSTLLTAITITGLWDYLLKIATPISTINQAQNNTVTHILIDPIHFTNILINTITSNFTFYLNSFVGCFGWLNSPLPLFMVFGYLSVLILVSLLDKNQLKIKTKQKIITMIPFSIISFLIFLAIYTTWGQISAYLIGGVQGRYFIPIAPMFFLIFYNNREKIVLKGKKINLSPKNLPLFIIIILSIYLSFSIFQIVTRFYMI